MPQKIYDLSQDLNADASFWPFYPPFEVKYFKRKSEHGVNAQDMFYPEDIEKRVEVRDGDILFINTGWSKYAYYGPDADEEKYIQRHPGPHYSICEWLLDKKIKIWGVDMVSTDH